LGVDVLNKVQNLYGFDNRRLERGPAAISRLLKRQ